MDMRPGQAIDNPEYFESNRNNNPVSSVNIADNFKSEKAPLRLRSMSSESEGVSSNVSEPDYYNEYDQLNKSKRPPGGVFIDPRTESTV